MHLPKISSPQDVKALASIVAAALGSYVAFFIVNTPRRDEFREFRTHDINFLKLSFGLLNHSRCYIFPFISNCPEHVKGLQLARYIVSIRTV